jgi:hypothetical protein
MGRNYGHDHRDKFELLLWGRGRLLYPDWNAQQYEPMEYGWTRDAWAHNTLVVDESNPQGGSFRRVARLQRRCEVPGHDQP